MLVSEIQYPGLSFNEVEGFSQCFGVGNADEDRMAWGELP